MRKQKIEIDHTVHQIKVWHIPQLHLPRRISRIIPLKIKLLAQRLYLYVMNKIKYKKEQHIKYSKLWYEEVYHSADIHYLPDRDYDEVMKQGEDAGEIDELLETFSKFHLPDDIRINWLEVACHYGKTPFVLAKKYENVHFYMFDFSEVAIEWCRKYNPIPNRTNIWQGDIRNINYNGKRLDNYFNVITCLDVTEHIPHNVYIKAIKEMHRVCKPDGLLILKQGVSPLREHIHILDEKVLVRDFERRGFLKIDELPNRCHVLKRVC